MIFLPEIAYTEFAYEDNSQECSTYFFKIKDNAPQSVKKEYEEWKKDISTLGSDGCKY